MKTARLLTAVPALFLVYCLTACERGGSHSSSNPGSSGAQGASITACFTANKTVNYSLVGNNISSNIVAPTRQTFGPMTYKGQQVTGQTRIYPPTATVSTETMYWLVTSSGVTWLDIVDDGSVVLKQNVFYPSNMSPGQTVKFNTPSSTGGTLSETDTLVGFEDITLAGKTFANSCHINMVVSDGEIFDDWFAPGYGLIKEANSAPDNAVYQYNGDL